MRRTLVFGLVLTAAAAHGAVREIRPGWNLFSKEQDVQLGREAQAEVTKQRRLVRNPELEGYVEHIGRILAKSPHAGEWAWEFHVVNDKNVNAFSLPGGFVYVNTGAIDACDNEAQLAGVMAHEMSHVALRHGTNQVTKAAALELPAMLAGALLGRSMLGQLARAGIGLTANSVLLKFSRSNEVEADYNGVEILADVGYNPLEMAHFFEKLESKQNSGIGGRVAEFLSDHPNPGNRVQAIQDEVREIPRKRYALSLTNQFPAMKALAMRIPAPPKTPEQRALTVDASGDYKEYRTNTFSLLYPPAWQVSESQQSNIVTFTPEGGIVRTADGGSAVGYGIEVSYYGSRTQNTDLRSGTQALISDLSRSNPDMRRERVENLEIGGQAAMVNQFRNRSPFPNETEVDWLITVARPEGLFYMIFIAPQANADAMGISMDRVVRSLRF